MEFLQTVKGRIPGYAKDIHLNLDGTISRSSLEDSDAMDVALATTFAAKNKVLTGAIRNAEVLSPEEVNGALTAIALMGISNVWYPYIEMADDSDFTQQKAELRMNAYANNGGVDKRRFEMYALTAPIISKCHFCIESHCDLLKNHQGMNAQQLRDVSRITAVINTAAQVIAAEQPHRFNK